MGQALYRKYRSKSLDEIIGQEHITETLSTAVKNGRISHAYLFTGPRGVGKTSIARILAHEINGLPYEHEDNNIDIIEIDAASNRGIDEIRDLREKVYMAPVEGKYKIYIIDEVHMLTTQAFNALLKTLEEPPAHVVFILATTEAHKLPDTIISRTQRHVFRPVERSKVISHLKHIAATEKIVVDDDALELFAAHGGGSFRDSISLLDQAGNSGKKVTRKTAESMLGIPPEEAATALLKMVASADVAATMDQLDQLRNSGYHPAMIAKQLGALLRTSYIAGTPVLEAELQLRLMQNLLEVAPAHDPLQALELALLRAIPVQQSTQLVVAPPTTSKKEIASATQSKAKKSAESPDPGIPAAKESPVAETVKRITPLKSDTIPQHAPLVSSDSGLDPAVWNDILNALKSKYNTLYGVMRMAVPEFGNGTMTLRFRFSFHQKRMNEAKHRKIIGDIVKELTGQTIAIECLHDKDAQLNESPIGANTSTAQSTPPSIPPESLTTISNIFGGGELVES